MTRARRLLPLLAAVLVALAPAGVAAEHEVFYRYVVLGYVNDARGLPMRAVPVEVQRNKTGFSYLGQSDDDGFYLVITRLGDESAGETLTLRVGTAVATLVARFDPVNHADPRGTRVDRVAGALVERPTWFRPTLAKFLDETR